MKVHKPCVCLVGCCACTVAAQLDRLLPVLLPQRVGVFLLERLDILRIGRQASGWLTWLAVTALSRLVS
eukprot:SAG22_NODE_1157_length_5331_cov_1.886086_3_plen_69_part_00